MYLLINPGSLYAIQTASDQKRNYCTGIIKRLNGAAFKARPWFYKANRSKIEQDPDLAKYGVALHDDEKLEYIVLKETTCLIPYQYFSILLNNADGIPGSGFVFYKCILPAFKVQEQKTPDWLIINTHIGGLTIV